MAEDSLQRAMITWFAFPGLMVLAALLVEGAAQVRGRSINHFLMPLALFVVLGRILLSFGSPAFEVLQNPFVPPRRETFDLLGFHLWLTIPGLTILAASLAVLAWGVDCLRNVRRGWFLSLLRAGVVIGFSVLGIKNCVASVWIHDWTEQNISEQQTRYEATMARYETEPVALAVRKIATRVGQATGPVFLNFGHGILTNSKRSFPREVFMARFDGEIAPVSDAERSSGFEFRDRTTGELGVLLSVDSVDFEDARASVEIEEYALGEEASRYRIDVGKVNDRWTVTEVRKGRRIVTRSGGGTLTRWEWD